MAFLVLFWPIFLLDTIKTEFLASLTKGVDETTSVVTSQPETELRVESNHKDVESRVKSSYLRV